MDRSEVLYLFEEVPRVLIFNFWTFRGSTYNNNNNNMTLFNEGNIIYLRGVLIGERALILNFQHFSHKEIQNLLVSFTTQQSADMMLLSNKTFFNMF